MPKMTKILLFDKAKPGENLEERLRAEIESTGLLELVGGRDGVIAQLKKSQDRDTSSYDA